MGITESPLSLVFLVIANCELLAVLVGIYLCSVWFYYHHVNRTVLAESLKHSVDGYFRTHVQCHQTASIALMALMLMLRLLVNVINAVLMELEVNISAIIVRLDLLQVTRLAVDIFYYLGALDNILLYLFFISN